MCECVSMSVCCMDLFVCMFLYSGVINYSNELCWTDIRKFFTSLDIEQSVRSGRNKKYRYRYLWYV